MYKWIMVAMVVVSGCASEPMTQEQYEARQRAAQSLIDASRAIGSQGGQAPMQPVRQPRQCTTTPNGFGGWVTNCY